MQKRTVQRWILRGSVTPSDPLQVSETFIHCQQENTERCSLKDKSKEKNLNTSEEEYI